jgi:hypothetical protein
MFLLSAAIPPRPEKAAGGTAFMESLASLSFEEREARILEAFLSGNVPDFLRREHRCRSVSRDAKGNVYILEYQVLPDYLAVGDDTDFCRVPMSPATAQEIADNWGYILTTPKLCDDIWKHAQVRLNPIAYAPEGNRNESLDRFIRHNHDINTALKRAGGRPGQLVAGIKKDIVICNAICEKPGRVAIYGWHFLSGRPVQPLYTGHVDHYVDYSHGVRLIAEIVLINGVPVYAENILRDPVLHKLLSYDARPMQPGVYPY